MATLCSIFYLDFSIMVYISREWQSEAHQKNILNMEAMQELQTRQRVTNLEGSIKKAFIVVAKSLNNLFRPL